MKKQQAIFDKVGDSKSQFPVVYTVLALAVSIIAVIIQQLMINYGIHVLYRRGFHHLTNRCGRRVIFPSLRNRPYAVEEENLEEEKKMRRGGGWRQRRGGTVFQGRPVSNFGAPFWSRAAGGPPLRSLSSSS